MAGKERKYKRNTINCDKVVFLPLFFFVACRSFPKKNTRLIAGFLNNVTRPVWGRVGISVFHYSGVAVSNWRWFRPSSR